MVSWAGWKVLGAAALCLGCAGALPPEDGDASDGGGSTLDAIFSPPVGLGDGGPPRRLDGPSGSPDQGLGVPDARAPVNFDAALVLGDAPPPPPDAAPVPPPLPDEGPPEPTGCADQGREAFLQMDTHPRIAGCAGGWTVPGVVDTLYPECGRNAGNTSADPMGVGCSVADLCGSGWHVCESPADVAASSPDGCAGALGAGALPAFFVTRQSGPGGGACGVGTDDLFGCGTLGASPTGGCEPLNRHSYDGCTALGQPWTCAGGAEEARNVFKSGVERGGVLCCRHAP